jgi:uncharacterized phage protein (TIGR01671 family)
MAQRIILFRGKHIVTGEWLYGSHFDDGGEQYILPNNILDIDEYEDKYEVDPATVGEYTGLTDKWGYGVYEGDILRLRTYSNLSCDPKIPQEDAREMRQLFGLDELAGDLEAESITAVCFCEGTMLVSLDWENDTYIGCLWGDQKRSNPIFDYEIIGNIHDNPDIKMQYSDRYNKS